jgi:SpoVK/Ycf46/Vps4 family AAA+-type ATPase
VLTTSSEVISEHTKKVLLRVTSGDLGTEPEVAEKKLQELFRLAHAWNAILLLDEADVFLSKRTEKDIKRNAFITVFLRLIEYFPGIMMLTTNQREAFDEAFQSRIHLQIPYPPATMEQRKAIWVDRVASQRVAHLLSDDAFERLASRYELNGRQIKNAVTMAIMVAKTDNTPLDEGIIEGILRMDFRSG